MQVNTLRVQHIKQVLNGLNIAGVNTIFYAFRKLYICVKTGSFQEGLLSEHKTNEISEKIARVKQTDQKVKSLKEPFVE